MTTERKNFPINIPIGWQPQDGQLFDVFNSYRKIGSCAVAFVYDQRSPRKGKQFFPNSWFVNKISQEMLPILEITGLETFGQQKSGNGRLCLQALCELSKHRHCGGRIQVLSDFNSAPFYEHCGFSGGEVGKDGLKYFDPTPQNITLLFPHGIGKSEFRFIPVSIQRSPKKELSQSDKILFERMLQKGQRS